jgi:hypothetical protein
LSWPRWARLLPGLWAGLLLGIALIAAPTAFAVLPRAQAGQMVARVFVQEAWLGMALAGLLLWVEHSCSRRDRRVVQRGVPGKRVVLLWGTVGCTLVGYFGVAWLMSAARAGQGPFGFGQLHAASTVFFAVKTLLVLRLAWLAGQQP